jgi:hypothetical protein
MLIIRGFRWHKKHCFVIASEAKQSQGQIRDCFIAERFAMTSSAVTHLIGELFESVSSDYDMPQ